MGKLGKEVFMVRFLYISYHYASIFKKLSPDRVSLLDYFNLNFCFSENSSKKYFPYSDLVKMVTKISREGKLSLWRHNQQQKPNILPNFCPSLFKILEKIFALIENLSLLYMMIFWTCVKISPFTTCPSSSTTSKLNPCYGVIVLFSDTLRLRQATMQVFCSFINIVFSCIL